MGGDIWVKSVPDDGSTFSVSLQLQRGNDALPRDSDLELLVFKRILVVDDNTTNLSIIEHQLSQCGLKADYEQHADVAVQRVIQAQSSDEGPYDLLVLDYLMPKLDGLSVNKAIREALPKSAWPNAIILSSAGILAMEQLKETGIKACINKPSSLDELRTGLSKAMRIECESLPVTTSNERIEETHYHDAELGDVVILVVEDMKANLAVVKGMLGQQVGRVEVAENGLEGVKKWRSLQPDLILMDLHMPIMDGLTAIKEIRQLEKGSGARVPILALTADIQAERIAEVYKIGGDGYLSKPFKRQELLDSIAHWLESGAQMVQSENTSTQDNETNLQNLDSLDPSVLDGLEELLGDQVKEIVMAFIEDADAVFVELDQARQAGGDAELFYRPAHSLKSISANVGAVALNELSATLETQARSGELLDVSDQVAQLKEEYGRVKAVLQQTGRLS